MMMMIPQRRQGDVKRTVKKLVRVPLRRQRRQPQLVEQRQPRPARGGLRAGSNRRVDRVSSLLPRSRAPRSRGRRRHSQARRLRCHASRGHEVNRAAALKPSPSPSPSPSPHASHCHRQALDQPQHASARQGARDGRSTRARGDRGIAPVEAGRAPHPGCARPGRSHACKGGLGSTTPYARAKM